MLITFTRDVNTLITQHIPPGQDGGQYRISWQPGDPPTHVIIDTGERQITEPVFFKKILNLDKPTELKAVYCKRVPINEQDYTVFLTQDMVRSTWAATISIKTPKKRRPKKDDAAAIVKNEMGIIADLIHGEPNDH